jgi:ketosteroid isomerase-like protein
MEGDGVLSTLAALSKGSREAVAAVPRPEVPACADVPEIAACADDASEVPACADADGARPSAEGQGTRLSNEAIVARLFDAFSRRDLASTLPLLHPEIVFQPVTAEVTRAGEPYRGHDGIRRYTEDIAAHWDELTVRPAQIRAAGCAVVAIGLVSGSGRAGSFKDAPTTWVIKFRDGLVVHVQIFSDARKARGALVGEDA